MHDSNERPAVMTRTMELVLAAFFFAIGALVMYDSNRLGMGWADDGPQSGYFPFYVGAIICLTTFVIFLMGLRDKEAARESFVSREALKLVLKVLVPTIVYVILIGLPADLLGIQMGTPYIFGIYVASAIFIAFFMVWIGKYGFVKVLMVAAGVPVVFFLLFEVWFRVPLPKGLLEASLGLL